LLSRAFINKKIKINCIKHKKYFLKEENRELFMNIYEDEYGTYVYGNCDLNMINYLEELSDIGVNTIRIDSFLHNEI
jgi:collagenase-like PrtC family protease